MKKSHKSKIKPIVFYLPQFHPIAENDGWWGKGFTEWTNVKKAKALFRGHYQPQIPTDMGYYDLRDPEIKERQSQLAISYGVYGFCYYHYWSDSNRLLERPVDDILASGKPAFPFCLCWANENWTRRWDGHDQDVLWPIIYSDQDDVRHMQWLCNVFKDPRYIKINNKPIFLVYRTCNLPDPARTAKRWREVACDSGIEEILLCNVESLDACRLDPADIGFDLSIEFQPIWDDLPKSFYGRSSKVYSKMNDFLKQFNLNELFYFRNRVINYVDYVKLQMKRESFAYPKIPCVFPSWDNSPRKGKSDSIVFINSDPELFGKWVDNTITNYSFKDDQGDKYFFVNAWNEWAESCYLEPCKKWGYRRLQAIKRFSHHKA